MDIKLNINEIVRELAEAKQECGRLTAKNTELYMDNEKLTKELAALRDEVSTLKRERAEQNALWDYTYAEKEKYRKLYEALTEVNEDV